MWQRISRQRGTLVALALAALVEACGAAEKPAVLPPPVVDIPADSLKSPQTAVFAGGCFWGIEAVYRHVKGVTSAVSGYAGGAATNANYEAVGSGTTGHAESVQVTYDPAQVSYGELLRVFFSVAHDPTQLNQQGPDTGTQYRSAIFALDDRQKKVAQAYIGQLDQAKAFSRPIVTEVVMLPAFYPAEAYHQNYAALHPTQPYIAIYDAPKVANLKELFPALYRQ
jgi:peptide-methionine (S)-S-oxide reductase